MKRLLPVAWCLFAIARPIGRPEGLHYNSCGAGLQAWDSSRQIPSDSCAGRSEKLKRTDSSLA